MTYADETRLEDLLNRWSDEIENTNILTEAVLQSDNTINRELRVAIPDYTPTAPYDDLLVNAGTLYAGSAALNILYQDEDKTSSTATTWQLSADKDLNAFIEDYQDDTVYDETKTRIRLFVVTGEDEDEEA